VTRRRALVHLLAAAALVAGCFGIEAPPGGIAAITLVLPPSPSVVVGDQSRDSTGAVAPFRVYAFDENGDTIRDIAVTFTALAKGLHFDESGVAFGDSVVPGGVPVIATVGPLQTTPLPVPVTVAPTTVRVEPVKRIEFALPSSAGNPDTTNSANAQAITVVVSGQASPNGAPADTFAVKYIVDFEIVDAPEGIDDHASAVLTSGNKASTRDSTEANGQASRTLQLRPVYFGPGAQDVLLGSRADTVRVRITVRDRGTAIPGNPMTVEIPICLKGSSACDSAT
jgi:hypothetical protein